MAHNTPVSPIYFLNYLLYYNLFKIEAEKARSALHGRYFGGRRVTAEIYDQTLFHQNDFSG